MADEAKILIKNVSVKLKNGKTFRYGVENVKTTNNRSGVKCLTLEGRSLGDSNPLPIPMGSKTSCDIFEGTINIPIENIESWNVWMSYEVFSDLLPTIGNLPPEENERIKKNLEESGYKIENGKAVKI